MARKSAAIVLAIVLAVVAAGCRTTRRRPPGPGGTGNLVVGTLFSGQVTDKGGTPVEKARVEVNGRHTFSAADGSFRLNVEPVGAEYILNITHPDFADLSHITRRALENQRWRLVRAQSETVDPTTTITLIDRRPGLTVGGATFTLPPNSLVDPRGNPPAGPLRATIATLDVANGEGPGDWAVRSDDGRQEGFLVSYGAVFVQFSDASGVTYQLRPGRVGQLSLPVLPNMSSVAPATPEARFWYYDTRDGYWKHNGEARFDSATGAYVGTVDHLSTINTDIAKFNDAACLKITLHPSVPFGRKLRIRYHSGGTPFGQTPTFVMNDVDNAAYRLPANTNVLLELLDGATDEPFGDFIVEDPAGTPLVNTVVNTGPALGPGDPLFPPPPFMPCKPILLRQGLPQVEIRINEMPGDPAPRDNPADDYLTWAPTFARARLVTAGSPITVVLTNDNPNMPNGGEVNFAAHVSPWPANTTATLGTLTLNLPGDGSWVSFVIAGRHLFPSANDKDTIVEAHLNTAAGPVVGTKAMMVRVRKNANTLLPSERARFLFAWRNFRNALGANYVRFQEMHRLASFDINDQGHGQPAFFPWHRAMLLEVERELQKIDPSVALHYWDWDAAAPNVFDDEFMGEANMDPMVMGFTAEPIFSAANPLNGWNTDLPFSSGELRRSRDDHKLPPASFVFKPTDHPVDDSLVDYTDYGPRDLESFSQRGEWESHDPAHGWPCAFGHVARPERSAADPLFYLLHSNVDRQWAYWQRFHNRHGVDMGGVLTFPVPAHYDNTGLFDDPGNTLWFKGAYLDDGQWPWDGTTGGAGRARRPPNQAVMPFDQNVPNSTPMIPMTPFPASVMKNLWPSAASVPRVRNLIDYLGRFRPEDGLGYCYQDVAY